jgi:hypothetical protein
MDFEKKAREIVDASHCDCGAASSVERMIVAALKAAYNEGLEDVAREADGCAGEFLTQSEHWHGEGDFELSARCHSVMSSMEELARDARSKKVPL